MPSADKNELRSTVLPLALLAGDTLVTFTGLALGYWLRYESPLRHLGVPAGAPVFRTYVPLLFVGVALLVAAFAQFGLYDTRLLLRRYQSLNAILKGAGFWLLTYLGLSLVLKFDPPISRVFVVIAFVCVVVLLYAWRSLAHGIVAHSAVLGRLRRRTVLLGWNDQSRALAAAILHDPAHPFALEGVVTLRHDTTAPFSAESPPPTILGSLDQLDEVLRRSSADLLILTRADLSRAEVQSVLEICERSYVEWKLVPGAFDIFLSSLHLQTIGRVLLLGVDELAINRLFNRVLKRAVDICGALAGLIVSAPAIGLLALLIKRESPGGPVFFRQPRIGAGHRIFTLWKLRSLPETLPVDSTRLGISSNDPRLLRVGRFMRRWNLDELPQFWNVLRGDMSLVGPRPEQPHLVDRLSAEIPHYLPRHLVKPGMTGWAQVNGLRGNTSIVERIKHDIYYIENWSLWLDAQIILLTFVRWKNAY